MIRILVELGSDRDRCGTLGVFDANGHRLAGPFPVAGRASDALAAARGNPRREPTLRYGDMPTGGFAVRGILKTGKTTPFAAAEYGPHGVVILEGISGEAAIAEANGRFQFFVQAGALAKDGSLRSTAGALRLSNEHQRLLVAALKRDVPAECDVVQSQPTRRTAKVFIDATCRAEDPPLIPAPGISRTQRKNPLTPPSHRDMQRSGLGSAAGFMALGLTFVIAPGSEPALATTVAKNQSASISSESKTATAPEATKDKKYVQLAYASPPSALFVDKDAFVNYMDSHAADAGSAGGSGATSTCREGLRAGGIDVTGISGDGKDYGPIVERFGAIRVASSDGAVAPGNYAPQKGDIAVFSGNTDHPQGYVQVWDGSRWVSDFKNKPGEYSPYGTSAQTPPSTIYRFPDKRS